MHQLLSGKQPQSQTPYSGSQKPWHNLKNPIQACQLPCSAAAAVYVLTLAGCIYCGVCNYLVVHCVKVVGKLS